MLTPQFFVLLHVVVAGFAPSPQCEMIPLSPTKIASLAAKGIVPQFCGDVPTTAPSSSLLTHGTYTALSDTGWDRPASELKPGSEFGLIALGHDLRVKVDFEVHSHLTAVVNHFREAMTIEISEDGVAWTTVATLPHGHTEVNITAAHVLLRWQATSMTFNGVGKTLEFHGYQAPGAPMSFQPVWAAGEHNNGEYNINSVKVPICIGNPIGWSRFMEVDMSAAGALRCKADCGTRGFKYFGMECPKASGQAHCQCSKVIQSQTGILDDKFCEGNGFPLLHAHADCVGPYLEGGFRFGDYGVASVYLTGESLS